MSALVSWIVQQNIARFSELLGSETDSKRRRVLAALLKAEQLRHIDLASECQDVNAPVVISASSPASESLSKCADRNAFDP